MSNAMYAFRVPKKDFWDVAARIRRFYREHGQLGVIIKRRDDEWLKIMNSNDPNADFGALHVAEDALRYWFKNHPVRLQVFEYGRDYVFRVLEAGYEFINHHAEIEGVRPCFYDDRTDENPGTKREERVMDRVDELLHQHRYFLYTVYDENSIFDMYFMNTPERKKEDENATSPVVSGGHAPTDASVPPADPDL